MLKINPKFKKSPVYIDYIFGDNLSEDYFCLKLYPDYSEAEVKTKFVNSNKTAEVIFGNKKVIMINEYTFAVKEDGETIYYTFIPFIGFDNLFDEEQEETYKEMEKPLLKDEENNDDLPF